MCRFAMLLLLLLLLTFGVLAVLAVLSFFQIIPIDLKWIGGAFGLLLAGLLGLLLLFSITTRILGRMVAGTMNSVLKAVASSITLQKQQTQVWKNPGQVAKLVQQLSDAGGKPIGYYKIAELPALQLQAFFHEKERLFALVGEEVLTRLVWCDVIAYLPDGGSVTCSSAGDDQQQRPPEHVRCFEPKAKVDQLLACCRNQLAGRAPAGGPEDFPRLYQDAYARCFAFRVQQEQDISPAGQQPLMLGQEPGGQTPDDPRQGRDNQDRPA